MNALAKNLTPEDMERLRFKALEMIGEILNRYGTPGNRIGQDIDIAVYSY